MVPSGLSAASSKRGTKQLFDKRFANGLTATHQLFGIDHALHKAEISIAEIHKCSGHRQEGLIDHVHRRPHAHEFGEGFERSDVGSLFRAALYGEPDALCGQYVPPPAPWR